jgi:AraC-like DNA-binding protein
MIACTNSRHRFSLDAASVLTKELVRLPSGSGFRILKWNDNLHDVFSVLAPDCIVRIEGEGNHWHYHQALELTLFTEGSGTRFVGDRIQRFDAGEVVLLGENLPHYWHTTKRSAGISVQFYFPPTHPLWIFPEAGGLAVMLAAARRGLQFHGRTATRLSERMAGLVQTDGLERLSLLLGLLATASSAPGEEREAISTQTFSLSGDSEHQAAMRAAMRFLLMHYREEISLAQLLEVTRMSKATFSRYFKRHAGKTLGEFLQQVRLEAACRELAETDKSVIEISLASGFSQISFFNRLFQRTLGCTPSAYRQTARERLPA